MLESLTLLLVLGILILGVVFCARGKNMSFRESFALVLCIAIIFTLVGVTFHFSRIIAANCTTEAKLSEYTARYEDLQWQVNNCTDQVALVTLMERVEEYNKEVAYGKTAAHSYWNAWTYPARLYDSLELVYVGGLPNEG